MGIFVDMIDEMYPGRRTIEQVEKAEKKKEEERKKELKIF